MLRRKDIKMQLNMLEELTKHYFYKLCNIEKIINNYEKSNGLNPYYLIQNIKKELDKPLNPSSSK